MTTSEPDTGEPLTEVVRGASRPPTNQSTRPPSSARRLLARFAVLVSSLLLAVATPFGAQAADGLQVTTAYPDITVAPGSKVSFDLKVVVKSPTHVGLTLSGVPDGWQASLRGGGYIVDGVLATPTDTPQVRLDVTVPQDAASKPYQLAVNASAGSLSDALPITIRVSSSSQGNVTLKSDFPVLRGPSSQTFTFSVTLSNDTAEDLTFSVTAVGPAGWKVTARPSGQTQAASFKVNAGSTQTVDVEADPPNDVAAGQYPIQLAATAGDKSVQGQLGVEITGQFSMSLTTPDGRLNASGDAGSPITRTLTIQNTGTAPLAGVTLSDTPPSGWNVKFDPPKIDSIAPGQNANVNAIITPAGSAIAGDYVVTFTAAAQDAGSSNVDIRVTVETSLLFGLVGVALIVAVLAGLAWVFQRYGRR